MSHPYAGHRQNAVGKRRANKLVRGNEYADGGVVSEDERQKSYEFGVKRLKAQDALGIPSLLRGVQRRQSERISDAVPRRKEDE